MPPSTVSHWLTCVKQMHKKRFSIFFTIVENSTLIQRLHSGEQQDLPDGIGVGEQHGQTVDTHAPACGWRQAVLQRLAEVLVNKPVTAHKISHEFQCGATKAFKRAHKLRAYMASSSPASLSLACAWKRVRCSTGSLSSVYALHLRRKESSL